MFGWMLFFVELYFLAGATTVYAFVLLLLGSILVLLIIGPAIARNLGALGLVGLAVGVFFSVAFSVTSVDAYEMLKNGRVGPISVNEALDFKDSKLFEFNDAMVRSDLARGVYDKNFFKNVEPVCQEFYTVAFPIVGADFSSKDSVSVLLGSQWAKDCSDLEKTDGLAYYLGQDSDQPINFVSGVKVLDYEKKEYLKVFNDANKEARIKLNLDKDAIVLRPIESVEEITDANFTIMQVLGLWAPLGTYVVGSLIFLFVVGKKSKKK